MEVVIRVDPLSNWEREELTEMLADALPVGSEVLGETGPLRFRVDRAPWEEIADAVHDVIDDYAFTQAAEGSVTIGDVVEPFRITIAYDRQPPAGLATAHERSRRYFAEHGNED